MTKTICLNMIVKDEAHVVKETLENITKYINLDYYVICDTGSSDNTKEIIKTFFDSKNIKGEIYDDKWVDFAHNRTKAINYAYKKTDYLLIFDADDSFHGNFSLPKNMDADAYDIQFPGYYRKLLISNHMRWKFRGVLHEILTNIDPIKKGEFIKGDYYIESGRTGNRNKNPNKYLDDAIILENAFNNTDTEPDLLPRYCFYCAQSYQCANGQEEKAIYYYKKTLELEIDNCHKYVCCYRLNEIFGPLNRFTDILFYANESIKYDKHRVEAILPEVEYYYNKGMHYKVNMIYNFFKDKQLYENTGKLFIIDENIMRFLHYSSVSAYYANDIDAGYYSSKELFLHSTHYTENCIGNFIFYVNSFKTDPNKKQLIDWFINYINDSKKPFAQKKRIYDEFLSFPEIKREYDSEKIHNYIYPPIEKLEFDKNNNNILFYTGYMHFKWNDTSLKNKCVLGGSEKAVIYLSRQLPKQYNIYIAGDQEEETIDNIKYIPHDKLQFLLNNTKFHSIIVSRYISFFYQFTNIRCHKLLLMAHDTYFVNHHIKYIDHTEIISNITKFVDNVICLTNWHKDNYHLIYPCLKNENKIITINNGINISNFNFDCKTKIKNKFIWSSCSARGLHTLLNLWENILNAFPDATLDICSYDPFPRTNDDNEMKKIIDKHDSIIHHGKLPEEDLYDLISKCEFWLYTTDFCETSCITAMEMLMSEVICLYYPIAGLNDTLGNYGIPVKQGEEIKELLNLTTEKKALMREKGKEYALSCSWKNRAQEWSSMLELNKKKWIFYCFPHYERKMIQQYIDNLNYIYPQYNIYLTNDKNRILTENPSKITFVFEVFDHDIITKLPNTEFSQLGTEPLTIPVRLRHILDHLKIFPNMKYYDYSKSNLKILEENGINIQDKIYLPYKCSDEELEKLINFNKNIKKVYDFGLLKGVGGVMTERREKIANFLKKHNFTVNIIGGWADDRDTELAKCKIILNIHGNLGTTISNIFEHIRCDRLLEAGFNILSEESVNLDQSFLNKYPNLQIIHYDEFFNIAQIIEYYNNKLSTLADNNYVLNILQDTHKRLNIPNEHINFLEKLSKDFYPENMIIYDIGSNVLHWTQNASKIWKNSKIHLFDGMTEMKLFYDEYNKQNNTNYEYNVGVLCDEDYKRISFYQNDELSGGNSYYKEIGHRDSATNFTENHIKHKIGMKLESIVKNKNIPMPDLIKIDVQGAELDILKGSMSIINKAKFLIVELQHTEYNQGAPLCNQTRDFLIEYGWQVYAEKFSNNGPDADWCFINNRYNDINNHIEFNSKHYIKKIYDTLCLNKNPFDYYLNPVDIYEHLPTLYKYASKCNSVLECGVRASVSSWALAHGLINNNSDNKKLILNDIEPCDVSKLLECTKSIYHLNVSYEWVSDLDLDLKENIDLTFIDSWHVGGHLKKELAKFSKLTNKYIIMHDTTIDEYTSEAIRANLSEEQIHKLSIESNLSVDEIKMGLWPAIEDFLKNNSDWVLHERFTNNNGLTILKKVYNKPKIIDCFTFYNELEMLNYRLNILNDVVDYFVLVEATHTHVGKEKPLFYQDNKHLFEKFNHKIIHIIVDDFTHKFPNINIEKEEQWINERYQRDCISRGIDKLSLQNNDVITITDLDEIPNPKILEQIKNNDIIVDINILELDLYYYNLNSKMDHQWHHSKILTFKKYNELNIGCDKIRFYNCPIIKNAGWHLSYFGNEKFIKNKLENFTHQEFNKIEFTDEKLIKERINNGNDLFDRPTSIINIPIEDNDNLPPDYDIYLKKFYNIHYKNIIFIHIPKTAGYAIGRCLRNCNFLKDGYGFSHNIARNIIKPNHINCVVLGVVRNPYDRLYSIFEFYNKKNPNHGLIDKNESFENFILNFEEKYYLQEQPFNTCYDFLTDKLGNLMTTDIIKFENLQIEYDEFCKKYNLENNLIKMNENKFKHTNIDWSKLYNNEMKIIVEKIFYKDFSVFNYSYSSFLNSKNIYTL